MEKKLFLTGGDPEARSRLIREALGDRLSWAGGFVMAAEPGEAGYAEGYALRPAASAAGVEGLPSPRFLDCRAWPPQRDNEVFRDFGVQLLREAAFYPFAVLDEIGGFETLIPEFREALEALLQSGLPLLGALKTAEEAEQWRQLFGLGEKMTRHTERLRSLLLSDPDARLLDLRDRPEAEVLSLLRAWAALHR